MTRLNLRRQRTREARDTERLERRFKAQMTKIELNRKIISQKRELDKLDKWFKAFDKECQRIQRGAR